MSEPKQAAADIAEAAELFNAVSGDKGPLATDTRRKAREKLESGIEAALVYLKSEGK